MGQFDAFIASWSASGGAERANKDLFLTELCGVLDVPRPNPTTGDAARDSYVFERDARLVHEGGTTTIGKIDLFKEGCFILEAKQGSEAGAMKLGTAKRGTPAWNIAMKDAYGQALGYARAFDTPVPFLVVADLGYCFDLYAAFDKSWDYRPFPNAQTSRLFLRDLATHAGTLRQIFLDPHDLDPSRHAAKVTSEIAGYLANLARKLETDGHASDRVATFLMRCLFTMFAEDVGLLPERMFTDALEKNWIPNPSAFPGGVESLWRAMNDGGHVMIGKILKFNGGLFADPFALPLDRQALDLLALAAECNWADVEPAIFGTLLERALDPKERHAIGAHYTPRAYVERLVRPTIEEPLRAEWQVVQVQVRQLVIAAGEAEVAPAPTLGEFAEMGSKGARQKGRSRAAQKGAQTAKINEAVSLLRAFHRRLCETRVLDPACGSGNFLYVTLDLFKRLEGEVLDALAALGETQELLAADALRVTPAQFLGIEVKRWAKEIAELVLWIGYLQWHFRAYGRSLPVPEPVLRDYKNIECRDALLAWDARVPLTDDAGKPVRRWDGTMKRSPVTGEEVPDEKSQLSVYRYVNVRKAEWPEAEFVVGNPPFIGSKRMRDSLGDGYVDVLRETYDKLADGSDYVLYWWSRAAERVAAAKVKRFGFITTNSITQAMNRRVLDSELSSAPSIGILWAIPDHPWVDIASGAAVRIAMTVVGVRAGAAARLASVVEENTADDGTVDVKLEERSVALIHSDLSGGAAVVAAVPLESNRGLCSVALVRFGENFMVDESTAKKLEASVVFPLLTGRDVNQEPAARYVIDFFPMNEAEALRAAPKAFQHVLEHVKPGRDQIRDPGSRARWWRFGRDKPELRAAIATVDRYIATSEVSKHRVFLFVPSNVRPDHSLIVVASDDAFDLGVLSSRVHVAWALAAGGHLGVGNDLRYSKSRCFEPFPFPVVEPSSRARIRDLGEQIDAHRKRQQAKHDDLTITGMYNVLTKLRADEPLTPKEKAVNERGLVSVLKKIHDDLDAAVLDAYGWPRGLTDEQILEKVVALNAERAGEERKGRVRWVRPKLQNAQERAMTQVAMAGDEDKGAEGAAPVATAAWPKKLSDQVAAVRDLMTRGPTEWAAADVAAALKGAAEAEIVEVLDSLTALGLLITYELPEGRRWRSAAYVSRRASG